MVIQIFQHISNLHTDIIQRITKVNAEEIETKIMINCTETLTLKNH